MQKRAPPSTPCAAERPDLPGKSAGVSLASHDPKSGTVSNFLFLSNVARPGNQIDRTVNTTQLFGTPPVVGPARPAPLFNQSDFWAQGVNVGLEFHW